jgi:hypothetical protein
LNDPFVLSFFSPTVCRHYHVVKIEDQTSQALASTSLFSD